MTRTVAMPLRIRRASSLAACLLLSVATARAEPPTPAQIDAMTDAMVGMFPVGKIMEETAAKDATWPLQERADKVTPQNLACMRQELSVPGVRRAKRAEVVDYAATHAASFAKDVETARAVAPLLGAMSAAGMKAGDSGAEVDYAGIMKSATSDQYLALITLSRDPSKADLRELTGFGKAIADGGDEDKNAQGKAIGELIVTKLMLNAMKTCDVPMSALFE